MSLSNHLIIPNLYSGLSTPDNSPPSSPNNPLPPHRAFSPPNLALYHIGSHGTDSESLFSSAFDQYLHIQTPSNTRNIYIPAPNPHHPSPLHRHGPNHYDTLSDDLLLSESPLSSPTTRNLNQFLHTAIMPSRPPSPPVMSPRADSLTRSKDGNLPVLEHLLSLEQTRKLSLAVDGRYIYAGSQSDGITVFSRDNLRPLTRLVGHRGSVLCLLLVEEKKWLISAGSDGLVRVWSTETLELLSAITPAHKSSGDIFCLVWDARGVGTLYFGAQSTNVEFITAVDIMGGDQRGEQQKEERDDGIDGSTESPEERGKSGKGGKRTDLAFQMERFFASAPSSPTPRERNSSFVNLHDLASDSPSPKGKASISEVTVSSEHIIASAHYGYIYCMEIIPRADRGAWLCTGSGDEDIKLWECAADAGGLNHLSTFHEVGGAVLSLASRDSLLYAGLQGGLIKIWDLETKACIRTIMIHRSDVMSISIIGSDAYTTGGDGRILRLDGNFDCTAKFQAHSGAVFASTICQGDLNGGAEEGSSSRKLQLVTTGHDSFIKVWGIPNPEVPSNGTGVDKQSEGDILLYALAKFISIQTVMGEKNREQCRQGAHFLKKFLEQLGAEAKLVPNKIDGKNPIVIATFHGFNPSKRALFYGHYDVVNTQEKDWKSNPFELSARNGYLYGRGVADDKGPIIATACAIASLRERRQLHADVVMVIEGEEESGSPGFGPAVESLKEEIGQIDVILLSNSSWITDEDPCIVWGMRGVLQAQLNITGAGRDTHSGVDGGVVPEPMLAMISLLADLHHGQTVHIPNFYSDVREVTSEELDLYAQIADITGQEKDSLMSKWRAPTFSVASINASGPAENQTVIPRSVTANVSFRLVPNQSLEVISAGLETYLYRTFGSLSQKGMHLNVRITHQARWWLASLDNFYFKKLEQSISEVWGKRPLKIREGGSIPTIPFLEALFDAPCVHLPMGQKSSAAHLANERLKLANLRNGKKVVETFLRRICAQKKDAQE